MPERIIGAIVVFVALLGLMGYGLHQQRVDLFQWVIIVFSMYGILVIGIGVFSKPKTMLKNDCYRPFVSVLVPARNEENVIASTVRSLAAMNYKKNNRTNFEIVVIDDCSEDATYYVLQRLRNEIPNLVTYRRDPSVAGTGKSAVLNEGLRFCKGEVIAVFDSDTRVDKNFLKRAVPFLYDPRVGGVQGRVRIYNAQANIFTKLQDDEFSIISHLSQVARSVYNGTPFLAGNGQLTRRSALEEADGWNETSVTEDLDLSIKLLLNGKSIRYCPEAVLWQEGIDDWTGLLRQRVRWAEGLLKCLFDYQPSILLSRLIPFSKKIDVSFSLTRIIVPLMLWVWYIYFIASLVLEITLYSGVHPLLLVSLSWFFFFVILAAFLRFSCFPVPATIVRVFLYWAYSFFWVLAVPLGYCNCIRNIKEIRWDKTFHKGDKAHADFTPIKIPGYRATLKKRML